MSPNSEESDIPKLLAERRLKRPPEDVLKNYVEEVRQKIAAEPAGPGWGVAVGLAVALALAAALVWSLVAERREVRVPAEAPGVSQALPGTRDQAVRAAPETVSDEVLESLEDDLFLLEMLGEDQGLLDVPERMETDLEVFSEIGLAG